MIIRNEALDDSVCDDGIFSRPWEKHFSVSLYCAYDYNAPVQCWMPTLHMQGQTKLKYLSKAVEYTLFQKKTETLHQSFSKLALRSRII